MFFIFFSGRECFYTPKPQPSPFPATWDDLDLEHPYRHFESEFRKGTKAAALIVKKVRSEFAGIFTHKEHFTELPCPLSHR